MRRTHSLIHRGYLYAQKRCVMATRGNIPPVSEQRMTIAEAWKQGYLQSRRDAKKAKT